MYVNPNARLDTAKQIAKHAGARIIGRPREQRDRATPRCTECGCDTTQRCGHIDCTQPHDERRGDA